MKTVSVFSVSSVLSQGLRVVLSNDFSVLGLFSSADALEEQLTTAPSDLVLIEIAPAISYQTLRRLVTLARRSFFILWIDSVTPEFVSTCLSLGVRGVLSKSASAETHIRCLTEVASGGLWIDQAMSHALLSTRSVRLTPRERQLVGLLVQGLSNKEVAWAMGISEGTVKVYLSRLFPKVGVGDRFELALLALKNLPDRAASDAAPVRRSGEPAVPIEFPNAIRISAATSQYRSPGIPVPMLPVSDWARQSTPDKTTSKVYELRH